MSIGQKDYSYNMKISKLFIAFVLIFYTLSHSDEWHLSSLPDNTDIKNYSKEDIKSVWWYENDINSSSWYCSSDKTEYCPEMFQNSSYADNAKGYWVLSAKSDYLESIEFNQSDNNNELDTSTLNKGWNLISSKDYSDISSALDRDDVSFVWGYKDSEWYLYLPSWIRNSIDLENTNFKELESIEKKRAYWVYVNKDYSKDRYPVINNDLLPLTLIDLEGTEHTYSYNDEKSFMVNSSSVISMAELRAEGLDIQDVVIDESSLVQWNENGYYEGKIDIDNYHVIDYSENGLRIIYEIVKGREFVKYDPFKNELSNSMYILHKMTFSSNHSSETIYNVSANDSDYEVDGATFNEYLEDFDTNFSLIPLIKDENLFSESDWDRFNAIFETR